MSLLGPIKKMLFKFHAQQYFRSMNMQSFCENLAVFKRPLGQSVLWLKPIQFSDLIYPKIDCINSLDSLSHSYGYIDFERQSSE